MKIVFTGAEFYLSNFLNWLKLPMCLFIVGIVIFTLVQLDDNKELKETFLVKNRWWLIPLTIIFNAYLFLVWS